MCWRPTCWVRRASAGSKLDVEDDVTNILIFGVTGMTGGAVAEAALGCAWFRVTGFTRMLQGEAYDELVSKGVSVFTGDMNKPYTIKEAMDNIDTVFLTTTYWETMNAETEYQQGFNVVTAAVQCQVKHIIYVGAEYSMVTAAERCKCLEGKAMIENYIVSTGIPYTIVRLGFYFENFLSLFKPHQTSKNDFAIALPMANHGLNCGSIIDFGHCIAKLALRPDTYVFKTLKLATSYLTVTDIAEKLNTYFPDLNFYNPKIPLSAYRKFDFEGATELTTMFAHYRSLHEWDRTTAMELYSYNRTFEQWLKDTDRVLLEIIFENMDNFASDNVFRDAVNVERAIFTDQRTIDEKRNKHSPIIQLEAHNENSFREQQEMMKKKLLDTVPLTYFFQSIFSSGSSQKTEVRKGTFIDQPGKKPSRHEV
ncbi:nmrA-like family domain-containing protein 1 isoform X3 [Biomphalaria glabrata]|uniref:NmrA-like family domain-containing protein 1 n=1 Tax=Biomphalaria glabrata TaxID=6526 RepID=A0A9W2Z9C5_BIOGL|nr:nmrA-like family domain-containing protein 1 isoform X3 [Biomphalaria glabrata]